MREKNLIRAVNGCIDCPFAVRGYCGLHPEKIAISLPRLGTVEPCPAGCPLRRGTALVGLLDYTKPRPGRPLPEVTAGRAFAAEVAHFRAWLAKVGGLNCPATMFTENGPYGGPLKIHHLRRALDGSRPFHEVELDTLVRYAAAEMGYGKPLPNPQIKPNE